MLGGTEVLRFERMETEGKLVKKLLARSNHYVTNRLCHITGSLITKINHVTIFYNLLRCKLPIIVIKMDTVSQTQL
jgi:hypothetical protein